MSTVASTSHWRMRAQAYCTCRRMHSASSACRCSLGLTAAHICSVCKWPGTQCHQSLPMVTEEASGLYKVLNYAGLGDYKDRNEECHQLFASKGYAVWTFDVHGHGDSEPLDKQHRVAIMLFTHLVDDAEQFMREVVQPWAQKQSANGTPLPIILHGTSMGGLVALHVVARQMVHVDGLIASAAAVGITRSLVTRLQEPFAPIMRVLLPLAQIVPALDANSLSHDPDVIRSAKEDPKLYKEKVRVCTACSTLDGTKMLSDVLHRVDVPVLMLHGSHDPVCSAEAARKALDGVQSKDKTWVLIDKALHDLDMDTPAKHEWFEACTQWLLQRF